MTPDPTIFAIQQNFIAYFARFAGLPGITFRQDDTITYCLNGHAMTPGNYVLATSLTGDIESAIDAVYHEVSRQAKYLDWLVFPGDDPADLGARFESRGITGMPGGTWMRMSLADVSAQPDNQAALAVRQVMDTTQLTQWSAVSASGFNHAYADLFTGAFTQTSYSARDDMLHLTLFDSGRPVTSGTLLLAGGIAGLYDIATPEPLRGRGYGTAMTWHLLNTARQRGYIQAWTLASAMGAPVYAKLGMVATDFGIREYHWTRPVEAVKEGRL